MKATPTDHYNYPRYDLHANQAAPNVISSAFISAATRTNYEIHSPDDWSSFGKLENGHLIVQNSSFAVTGTLILTGSVPIPPLVSVSGSHTVPAGSEFRLYDDDNFGLPGLLPRTNLVDDVIKDLYIPAFIDARDADAWNSNKEVDFQPNADPETGTLGVYDQGVFDDNLEAILEGSNNCWCATVIASYQPGIYSDKDPNSEEFDEGLTPQSNARFSVIYTETIREAQDSLFRGSTAAVAAAKVEDEKNLRLTAAHEIGHLPLFGRGNDHHNEGGLMGSGGSQNSGGTPPPFSAVSVRRFREILKWRQKE